MEEQKDVEKKITTIKIDLEKIVTDIIDVEKQLFGKATGKFTEADLCEKPLPMFIYPHFITRPPGRNVIPASAAVGSPGPVN